MFNKFLPYMSNNHNEFPPSGSYKLGSLNFSKLIGRELNEDLWEILSEVFNISRLRIYKPNDSRWLDGTSEGTMYLYLDESNKVRDFYYHPYHNYIIGQDVDKEGNYYKKGIISLVCELIKKFKLRNMEGDIFECIKTGIQELECSIDDNLLRTIIENEFQEIDPKFKWFGTSRLGEGYFHCPYPPNFVNEPQIG